ncbi:OmpA family protein [Iodidimonas sp. SYSU 1G8]|uniref:OmpA family protein n=1 Tax=Iodidimonas sp. SYSU 1G8 TaxID=3133967 RepID=UPI0031FEF72A
MSGIKVLCGVLGSVVLLGGCATKEYVNEQVGAVQTQVSAQQQQISALDARTTAVEQAARDALQRANAAHQLAEGKFAYSVVMSADIGPFKLGGSRLTDEFKAQLGELAGKLKAENRNAFLEIQGYTDESGSRAGNYRLGLDRAEAVRRYLSQQGVALNRMSSISYGQDVQTSGSARENRRVVVVVLE